MHLSSEDVAQIVTEVWTSMLGLEAERLESPGKIEGKAIAGSVGVSGGMEAQISLEMSEEAAMKFAGLMFGLEPDAVSDDDVADSVGELTNMVGGNIKSLIADSGMLSLPVVAQGRVPTLRVVGGQVLLQDTYLADGNLILVTVWNRQNS
ncbi:MAG: chemotaxis protein CheX [Austwickia sp.]|jgi:chemotaxis protein CheX|nr:chemotaxis protein CheX [Austwickia sp.]MBK8436465.1 chemotaxis protein CheX [Austwickia sp.]MBK9102141.1 chemotaxis protein CheX [Austwickia sp.]